MTVAGRGNLEDSRLQVVGAMEMGTMQVTEEERCGRGEIRKRREEVKLESAIPESAFDVDMESVANNAALTESRVAWRHMSSTCIESGVLIQSMLRAECSTTVICVLWWHPALLGLSWHA
jgi:hypothetical protein